MAIPLRNIRELCRHEYLRERRSLHFSRNVIVWALKLVLWVSIAVALPVTLEAAGIGIEESLPMLLLADQAMRWFSQSTPMPEVHRYRLLPVRRWHVITAYLFRMLFVPINFIWLPALWPQWWLVVLFILSGYFYLACWHTYLRLVGKKSWGETARNPFDRGGLLSCETKMRLRIPGLRKKVSNGLLASVVLTGMSIFMGNEAYTDFVILYSLTFPTLPVLASRLGYEQSYMSLLRTRMHGLHAVVRAKYLAALLWLLPGVVVSLIPVALGFVAWERLAAWTLGVALIIYPVLVLCAPRSEVGSPLAQMTTLLTLTLPILITQLIKILV